MKKRKLGKAAALFLVTALAAGTALSGCGKKSVDYDVDDDGAGGDGGKLASKLEVPESYEATLEGIDTDTTGLSEVSIKTSSITVPDTDKMSVVYYQENAGDNEYRQRVCESFFDVSAGIYVYDWEKPYKEDVERSIEQYQQYADEATDDDERTYWEEQVTYAKEQLTTATTEREGAGDYSADTYVGSVGENEYMISFMTGDDGTSSNGFSIDYYPTDSLIEYKPMDGASTVYCYSSDYSDAEDSANEASLSEEEAVQKGLEFLAGCGITDVVETNTTDLIWEFTDSQYNVVATERNGYVVAFKRSVEGVAPYTPYIYNLDILNSSSDDVWYDSMDETFELNIDDNGIVSAICYDLLTATGDKDENVDLLTFEEAVEKLPDAINTCFKDTQSSYSTIEFNDVRLAYYKIKDGDTYKYAPVWAFAQCDNAYDSDGNTTSELDTEYPVELILLDATTGDYIDLTQVLDSETYDDYEVETDDSSSVTIDEDGNIVDEDGNIIEEDTEEDTSDEISDDASSDETGDDSSSDDTSDESESSDSSDSEQIDISDADVEVDEDAEIVE